MRALQLDYVRDNASSPKRLGFFILTVSIIFAIFLVHQYQHLSQQLEQAQIQLQSWGRRHGAVVFEHAKDAKEQPQLRAEIEEGNHVIWQLSLPWNDLFSALEAVSYEQVAVLGFQPNPENGIVTISAEAKDSPAIAEYISSLEESGVLKDPHLISHEVKTLDPQKPLSFVLTGMWSEATKPKSALQQHPQ